MDLDHLMWEEDGWGYLPPTEEVFNIMRDALEISNNTFIRDRFLRRTLYNVLIRNSCQRINPEITSCCPAHPRGIKYSQIVKDKYPNVSVHLKPSPLVYMEVGHKEFDLGFIDGSHDTERALTDFLLCSRLNIPYVLFDNAEWSGIREMINYLEANGHIQHLKDYNYLSKFKGKKHDSLKMTLVKIT